MMKYTDMQMCIIHDWYPRRLRSRLIRALDFRISGKTNRSATWQYGCHRCSEMTRRFGTETFFVVAPPPFHSFPSNVHAGYQRVIWMLSHKITVFLVLERNPRNLFYSKLFVTNEDKAQLYVAAYNCYVSREIYSVYHNSIWFVMNKIYLCTSRWMTILSI